MTETAASVIDESNTIMTVLKMEEFCSWGKLLEHAPLAIAILGQLLGIATKKDFRLDDKKPQGGFKHLMYPHSFRASLVQLSNLLCETIMKADISMKTISLQIDDFVSTFKMVHECVKYGTKEEKQELAQLMDDLKLNLDKCCENAKETEDNFNSVVNFLDEISIATTGAKGSYENIAKETAAEIKSLNIEQRKIEEIITSMKQAKSKISDELAKAENTFEKSMEDVPGTAIILALEAVDAVVNLARDKMDIFAQLSSDIFFHITGADEAVNEDEGESQILKCLMAMNSKINSLTEIFEGTSCNWKINLVTNKKKISEIESALEYLKRECEKSKDAKKRTGIECLADIETLKNVCFEMLKFPGKEDSNKIYVHLCRIKTNVQQHILQQSTVPKASINQSNRKRSKVDRIIETAENKIKVRKEMLFEVKREHEQYLSKKKETDDHEVKVLQRLAKLNIDRVDFDEIQNALKDGLKSLAKIQHQWTSLRVFFTNMTMSLDIASQLTCKIEKHAVRKNGSIKPFMLETCGKVECISYGVFLIANSYKKMSKDFLLPNVFNLNEMITFDPETEAEQLKDARETLMKKLKDAQFEIKRLEQENSVNLKRKVNQIDGQLQKELEERYLVQQKSFISKHSALFVIQLIICLWIFWVFVLRDSRRVNLLLDFEY